MGEYNFYFPSLERELKERKMGRFVRKCTRQLYANRAS